MLLLDSRIEVGGITLYRDHASAATFHYLPSSPEILIEGTAPGLQLIRFRSDIQSGGVLFLDVQLRHDEAVLQTVRQELLRRYGMEANLVPVLFNRGSVRLSVLDFQNASEAGGEGTAAAKGFFIETVVASAVPSLMGHQRAIFSVRLSPEAATLLAGAILERGSPAIVSYDLEFSGIAPARGIRARVRYAMAYDYLRSRMAVNSLWFKTDLDREAEELSRKGLIEIEDVDYEGVDPAIRAQRAEEIRATLLELMQGLFVTPAASPASVATVESVKNQRGAAAQWIAAGAPQAAFVLRALEQHEEQVLTYESLESRVAARHAAPQGALRLPTGADASRVVIDVTADWPPPITQVRVLAAADADWSGVSAVEVQLRSGTETRTAMLTPAQRDQTANFSGGQIEYSTRVIAAAGPEDLGKPASGGLSFQPLSTATLFLDPAVLSGRWILRLALGAVDLESVRKVIGELAIADQRVAFLLDPTRPEITVPVWGREPVHMTVELILAAGESIAVEQDILPATPLVLINQPAGRFHTVTVMLQDPLNRFEAVHVELEAAAGGSRQALQVDSSHPALTWSAPRDPSAPRAFRYRLRQILRDSSVVEQDWREGFGSLLVVGDTDLRIEAVDGFLVGAGHSLGGMLQFKPADPPQQVPVPVEIVLDAGQTAFHASLPFQRDAERRYTVSGQIFLDSGRVEITPHEETAEVLILPLAAQP